MFARSDRFSVSRLVFTVSRRDVWLDSSQGRQEERRRGCGDGDGTDTIDTGLFIKRMNLA